MGIRTIHITLIVIGIVSLLFLGFWTLQHNDMIWASISFIVSIALTIYCVRFIRTTKA